MKTKNEQSAWAVVSKSKGELQMWGSRELLIFDTKIAAQHTARDVYGKGGDYKVIPVFIHIAYQPHTLSRL